MKNSKTTTVHELTIHRRTTLLALGPLLLLAGGCSPAPMSISQSPRDPSSPTAPEGVDPMVASAKATTAAEPESSAHEHHHAANDGVVYACPMHPEVTSDAPGVCPKCNMKLVKK